MSAIKATRTRNLRYKRPALASMGWESIWEELYAIQEACSDIHWFIDQDDDTLLNALDGDEEEAWEFKMAFAELEAQTDQLTEAIHDRNWWYGNPGQTYNDCTVAIIGNRYRVVGFDAVDEDYLSLTSYEKELAQTEAGKRLTRLTKAEMLSTIGQCMGTLIAFLDLRQRYDYLKATFDILRDENTSLLKQIKEIDAAYEEACGGGWNRAAEARFDRLLEALPDRAWVE